MDSSSSSSLFLNRRSRSGQKALLAYNRTGTPLQQSNAIVAHIGYDGWYRKVAKVSVVFPLGISSHPLSPPLSPYQLYDMSPLPDADAKEAGLSTDKGAQWFTAEVEVPMSAMVLNFVFSDKDRVRPLTVMESKNDTATAELFCRSF